MPRLRHRSRSVKRVKTRTPGGRTVTHYVKRKREEKRCPITGLPLTASSRPYGGVFSHRVLAKAIKYAIRKW